MRGPIMIQLFSNHVFYVCLVDKLLRAVNDEKQKKNWVQLLENTVRFAALLHYPHYKIVSLKQNNPIFCITRR